MRDGAGKRGRRHTRQPHAWCVGGGGEGRAVAAIEQRALKGMWLKYSHEAAPEGLSPQAELCGSNLGVKPGCDPGCDPAYPGLEIP